MVKLCTLLVCCGCNQLLGLGDVQDRHIDAQQFDMMLDAAATCPTGVAPHYNANLHQIPMAPDCQFTTVAETGDVMAMCAGQAPWFGTVANGLAPIRFVPPIDTTFVVRAMKIAPEGDFGLAYGFTIPGSVNQVVGLRRNPDDANGASWRIEGVANFLPISGSAMSNVTRLVGGQRRLLVVDDTATMLQSYIGDGETWALDGSTTTLTLTTVSSPPELTPDGLHLVVGGGDSADHGTFYFERTALDQSFGPALYVKTVPLATFNPFMSNDCGRIYFDAIETVLYVEQ